MDEKKNKKFISEKIMGRELTSRRAFKYLVISIVAGLLFGSAAFLAFHIISTRQEEIEEESLAAERASMEASVEASVEASMEASIEASIEASREAEKETETLPLETEPEGQSAGLKEDESSEVPVETVPALTKDDVQRLIEKERKNYKYSQKDLGTILSTETGICEEISRYIVTVDAVISEQTWFESTIETKRSYSGIIVGKSRDEILILTVPKAMEGGDAITVTFSGGARQNAIVKKSSKRDGLLVLAVPTDGLGEEFLETAKPVTFCQDTLKAGTPVIAAGSPEGAAGSFAFGNLSYLKEKEEAVDGSLTSCYADIDSRSDLGTFLMDLSGRLVGIAFEKNEEDPVNGSRFIAVSSLTQMIDSLKKGTDLPYFGLSGRDITFDMKYENIPVGMYITDVESDSPAFTAGLKRGDILTEAMGNGIAGTSDYLALLRRAKPGEEVVVKVMRGAGINEYTELELTITAGVR